MSRFLRFTVVIGLSACAALAAPIQAGAATASAASGTDAAATAACTTCWT